MSFFIENISFPIETVNWDKYLNTAKNSWCQKCIYKKQIKSKLDKIYGIYYFVTKSFAVFSGESVVNPLISQGRMQFLTTIKVPPYCSQLASRSSFLWQVRHNTKFFLETLSLCYFVCTWIFCLANTWVT